MSHTFEHTGYQQLHGCMHNVLTTKTAWPLLPCCWGYSLGLFFLREKELDSFSDLSVSAQRSAVGAPELGLCPGGGGRWLGDSEDEGARGPRLRLRQASRLRLGHNDLEKCPQFANWKPWLYGFIGRFPIESGDFPVRYVELPEGT